jgi:hypothetical protein
MTLGNGFEQLGFTGPLASSAMVNAYGLRGNFGFDYAMNPCNTIGVFYQTRLDFSPARPRRDGRPRQTNLGVFQRAGNPTFAPPVLTISTTLCTCSANGLPEHLG